MLIEVKKVNEGLHYANVLEGKKRLELVLSHHYFQVVVHNASHKVWKGYGKYYKNLEHALEHYKSAAVREMIQAGYEAAKENFQ